MAFLTTLPGKLSRETLMFAVLFAGILDDERQPIGFSVGLWGVSP